MRWIDLFNIGNVMLMRGQDLQVPHRGLHRAAEYDTPEQVLAQEEAYFEMTFGKKPSGNADEQAELAEQLQYMPELALPRCQRYSVAKDTFTEIVLLTVIAYFCVSTEHRFINMNMERAEKSEAEKRGAQASATSGTGVNASSKDIQPDQRLSHESAEPASGGIIKDKSTSSNQSLPPKSIRSAGGLASSQASGGTLQRSTKDRTIVSST